MALAASPPPPSKAVSQDVAMTDSLDDDIAKVRAEIQNLTKQRKLLASSLLASTEVQSRLKNVGPPISPLHENLTSKVETTKQHFEENSYRLGFGVTSFSFNDPSPEMQSKNPLLGIRFDVCNREGRFDSPYYIFCTRGQEVSIHRHTLPALVPLQQYEKEYLMVATADEQDGHAEDSMVVDGDGVTRTQNLHALVGRVRQDLVEWKLRQDAVDLLREQLDIRSPEESHSGGASGGTTRNRRSARDDDAEADEEDDGDPEHDPVGRFDICEIELRDVDARQFGIVWANGWVARVRISDTGTVDRAVVIDTDSSRVPDVERILTEGSPNVDDLLQRLEKIYTATLARRKG